MRLKIRENKNVTYLKTVNILIIGVTISQIIAFAFSPILTRLYDVELLGVYSFYVSLITLFGPIMVLRYDLILVTADDSEKDLVLSLGLFLNFIVSFILAIILIIFIFFDINFVINFEPYSILLIIILFLNGLFNLYYSLNNREEKYKSMAYALIIKSFVQNGLIVITGSLGMGIIGMLVSRMLGLYISIIPLSHKIIFHRYDRSGPDFCAIFKKYNKQFFYSTPASLINSLSYTILLFFVGLLYNYTTLGYFSYSLKVLGIPLSIFGVSFSKVFFQKASMRVRNNLSVSTLIFKISSILMVLGLSMIVFMFLWGKESFKLVFGDGYQDAGVYAAIMSPMYSIRLIVTSISPSLIIYNEQKKELIMQSLFVFVALLIFGLAYFMSLGIEEFLVLISIMYSVVYIIFFIYIYKRSKI